MKYHVRGEAPVLFRDRAAEAPPTTGEKPARPHSVFNTWRKLPTQRSDGRKDRRERVGAWERRIPAITDDASRLGLSRLHRQRNMHRQIDVYVIILQGQEGSPQGVPELVSIRNGPTLKSAGQFIPTKCLGVFLRLLA